MSLWNCLANVYNKGDPYTLPATLFPSERLYRVTVVANDEYVSYTENFDIAVEFAVDYDFSVSPSLPVNNDRTTGRRTFVLQLNLLEIKATNPQYIVNWGDGSDVASAQPLSTKCFTKHVYEKSGIYTISVTGFNKVSEKILNKTVSFLFVRFI